MARASNLPAIAYPTKRGTLPIQSSAHGYTQLAPGVSLGYCRRKRAGRWQVRVANGKGGEWFKIVGVANDVGFAEADGVHVLDWGQAQVRALKIARGEDGDGIATEAPATVDSALTDYARDLKARKANPGNATTVRHHMTPGLLAKFVAMLTDKDLRNWRNGLIEAGVKQPTVARVCRSLRAALNLAADGDPKRITNRTAWRKALGKRKGDDSLPRKFEISDELVWALVDAAYALDSAFGLLCHVDAETGARMSQLARIEVGGLHLGPAPKLTIPPAHKGHANKHPKEVTVPISPELAVKLEAAAGDRAPHAPLLIMSDSQPWNPKAKVHDEMYKTVATQVGEKTGQMYLFRHASIQRQILNNVTPWVIADNHDTSIGEIQKTYGWFINKHKQADEMTRAALLKRSPASNVVPLSARRA